MQDRSFDIKESRGTVLFKVKVQPGASANKIIGIEGNSLKIKLMAPPVEGKANDSLIDLLSSALDIKRSAIDIIKGARSRIKIVGIAGMTKTDLIKKLSL